MDDVKNIKIADIPYSIKEIAKKIEISLSPEKIILFGSYATGNATFDSDVDLLIILNTKLRGAERIRLISKLIYPRLLPLDIVVKTPEEIEKSKNRIDPFLSEVLERGIELYAKS
ncbi:nucleotidyltransferase domain-containing protein [candidate division KSB1 bacterium]|nr:nucleotidyltransferase domain-containing protein [candidate division KSB1 bacterium]MBL7094142.1 nucleotidyltransferase domain-containing protein [candidate division KSB1 bacterium]